MARNHALYIERPAGLSGWLDTTESLTVAELEELGVAAADVPVEMLAEMGS